MSDRALAAAFSAAKEAVDKANTASEKRFDGVNEFRAQLSDQAGTFITRELADNIFCDLKSQIQVLRNTVEQATNKEGGSSTGQKRQLSLISVFISETALILSIGIAAGNFHHG